MGRIEDLKEQVRKNILSTGMDSDLIELGRPSRELSEALASRNNGARFIEMPEDVRRELIDILTPYVAKCSTLSITSEYWGGNIIGMMGLGTQVLSALIRGRENDLSHEAGAFMLEIIYGNEVWEREKKPVGFLEVVE